MEISKTVWGGESIPAVNFISVGGGSIRWIWSFSPNRINLYTQPYSSEPCKASHHSIRKNMFARKKGYYTKTLLQVIIPKSIKMFLPVSNENYLVSKETLRPNETLSDNLLQIWKFISVGEESNHPKNSISKYIWQFPR